jgi:hypothetical protein
MSRKSDLIGYCGIYCGDCPGHTQTAANLARDMRKELRQHRFDKTAQVLAKFPLFKQLKDYHVCYAVLGTMTKLRCERPCRSKGGSPKYGPMGCCRKRKIDGCWQCDDFPTCKKLRFLEVNHGVAHLRNLRKIKKAGPAAFVKGKRYWYAAK